MTKIIRKANEPYTWDINGEDYWIINENNFEQEENELDLQQGDSSTTTATNLIIDKNHNQNLK